MFFCKGNIVFSKDYDPCINLLITIDHLIPKKHGGRNRWVNYVLSCSDCNGKKQERLPTQYEWKQFYILFEKVCKLSRWQYLPCIVWSSSNQVQCDMKRYIFQAQDHYCFFCQYKLRGQGGSKRRRVHYTSFVPVKFNGLLDWRNIVVTCKRCSHEYRNRIPTYYEWGAFYDMQKQARLLYVKKGLN